MYVLGWLNFIMAEKRKRTPNFSQEEKMQFVRAVQMWGKPIITKVTAHDTRSNKEKEEAWEKIACHLNASSASLRRDSPALKKLWQKLKSEAKIYKSVANHQARGTGGGPSKDFNDPILELVVELTGRGSSGITDVPDCDSEVTDFITQNQPELEPQTVYEIIEEFEVEDQSQDNITIQGEAQSQAQLSDDITLQEDEDSNLFILNKKKRRHPKMSTANERTPMSSRGNMLASTKLLVEKDKLSLIKLQKEHMKEMQELQIKHEKEKHEVQMEILREIKKRIQDAENIEPKLLKEFMNLK